MNTRTAQHTPGPWHSAGLAIYAKESTNSEFYGHLRDYSNPIANVVGDPMSDCAELETCTDETGMRGKTWRNPGVLEAEANARLIAAAPELLAALEMVADLNPYSPNATKTFAAIEQAKLVIEKAKGGAA